MSRRTAAPGAPAAPRGGPSGGADGERTVSARPEIAQAVATAKPNAADRGETRITCTLGSIEEDTGIPPPERILA
jgi:hypothetical protein